MNADETLILIPTHAEAIQLLSVPPIGRSHVTAAEFPGRPRAVLTGFGLAAAGTLTARHLSALRPKRCLLVGLAGTLDKERAKIGTTMAIRSVESDGIGVGQGDAHQSAGDLGFFEAPGVAGSSLSLDVPPSWKGPTGSICSVAAGSEHAEQAAGVRSRHPNASLEDMETWAVALACRDAGVPLTVLRSVSNHAGDRDRANWRVNLALQNLLESMRALLGGNGAPGEAAASG